MMSLTAAPVGEVTTPIRLGNLGKGFLCAGSNNPSFFRRSLENTNFKDCSLQEVDFTKSDLTNSTFNNCDLSGAIFENTVLEKSDLRTSFNFSIDPEINQVSEAKFSIAGIVGLLDKYNIEVE